MFKREGIVKAAFALAVSLKEIKVYSEQIIQCLEVKCYWILKEALYFSHRRRESKKQLRMLFDTVRQNVQ